MGKNRNSIALHSLVAGVLFVTNALADPTVGRGRSSDHNATATSGSSSAPQSDLLECNQQCQYRHAYETVLLQMTYLAQKSAVIQAVHDKGGRDQDILKATETVCTVNSADKCVEQYKVFAAYSLIELRNHAAYLQNTMASQTPGRQQDGNLAATSAVMLNGNKPGVYSSKIYTLSDMEEFYKQAGVQGQKLSKAKIKESWAELVKTGLTSAVGTIDFTPKLDKKRVEAARASGESTNRQMYYRYEQGKDGKEVQDDAFAKYRSTVIKKADREIAKTQESGSDVVRPSSMKTLKKDDAIGYEAWTRARTRFGKALKTADGQVLPDNKGKPEQMLGDDESPQLSGKSSTGVTMSGIEDADALMEFGGVKKTVQGQ